MAKRAVKLPPTETVPVPPVPAERMVWRDCRCRACGRLLCRAIITNGTKIEIRCPRCAAMVLFPPPKQETAKVTPEIVLELAV